MSKSPASRVNDGHIYTMDSTTPANKLVRRMAELVLHDRVVHEEPKSRRPPTARFSDEQVRLMRKLHTLGRVKPSEFALLLGMSVDVATKILNGTNYSKVL